MKRFFFFCFSLIIAIAAFGYRDTTVDEKLVQLFKASFPAAKEVVWHESTQSFIVHFVEDGIPTTIYYWKDGQSVKFIRYYQQRNLPAFIRYNVKKKYSDQTIIGVTEISTVSDYSNVVYYLKLEDAKNLFTVKVNNDGSLRTVEKFRKS